LEKLDKLKERTGRLSVEGSRLFNPGWHLAQDLKAMLTVSEAVTRSALARQESRGAHSRIDYAGPNPAWGAKNNVIVREGSTMALRQTPVPEMPNELKQLVADEK
jgi:succinate dehydrogenase / fumarate reductase flavoprotein subunit